MAVVIAHKNESITSLLLRFQQQVLKEGVIKELIEQRYHISRRAKIRKRRVDYYRLLKRAKRRARKKVRIRVSVKPKVL